MPRTSTAQHGASDANQPIGVSVKDAERKTDLSRSTLYRLMNDGTLPYRKVGARRIIPHTALVRLVGEAT